MSFAEILRGSVRELRQANANGVALTESDIWSNLPFDQGPLERLLCLVGPDDAGIRRGTQLGIVAPLSFSVDAEAVNVFRTWPEFRQNLLDMGLLPLPLPKESSGNTSAHCARGCEFFFETETNQAIVSRTLDDIAECVDLVRRGSLILRNIRRNDQNRRDREVPPAGNATYACMQHFLHHFAPTDVAGFVFANGSMSSNQFAERNTAVNLFLKYAKS